MKKIKIGDNVKVILGDDKGKIGKIKSILRKKNQIIIEGLNNKIKHLKPSQKDKIGKIINFSAPLDISNVMICNSEGVISRIGFTSSKENKLRIFKKTKVEF
jgi:large subunit ribosomal protein L24